VWRNLRGDCCILKNFLSGLGFWHCRKTVVIPSVTSLSWVRDDWNDKTSAAGELIQRGRVFVNQKI
jgi:hypothetical protein